MVVSFSEAMDHSATEAAFVAQATWWYSGGGNLLVELGLDCADVQPERCPATAATYDAAVASSATDAAGVGLANAFASSFRIAGPGVTLVNPADGGSDVAVDKNVVVTFSEAMNKTVTQSAFGLRKQGLATKVSGAFT